MNTGTYRRVLIGLTALLLSACSQISTLGLLEEIGLPSGTKIDPPLINAQMVQGNVSLIPPAGFCIDPRSLTQRFALMARCDVLGAGNGALDAPLGLLTASFAPSDGSAPKAADVAILGGNKVLEMLDFNNIDIVRAQTETPPNGMSKDHMRAIAQIGDFDVSLAVYAPPGSAAQGPRGALMLQELVQASQGKSTAQLNSDTAPQEPKGPKAALGALFGGLFE